MKLRLYNTLSNTIEEFTPINLNKVKMYICGPTVYDRPHIGNARPAVIFDVLYRLLKHIYNDVVYVRNITDIDDKIYKASKIKNISIDELTNKTIQMYHEDTKALNVLPVDIEPRATQHISDIIEFIKHIIDLGHAYYSQGYVYFDVNSISNYGILSNQHELKNGSRVEISNNKKNPADFILWKPTNDSFPIGWNSPWGKGRPGWHIECSAMSHKYLGNRFDIHGGGCDLIFPHHENEIAQSYAVNSEIIANYWIHNGHVMINGTKMSKSLGNFYTVHDLINEFDGEVIRLALLMTHYRSPLNFSKDLLNQSKSILDRWYNSIMNINIVNTAELSVNIINSLLDDLNTPKAISYISSMVNNINKGSIEQANTLINTCRVLLGIMIKTPKEWFQGNSINKEWVKTQIKLRTKAKELKNYPEADRIRTLLSNKGIELEDTPHGTQWKLR